MATRKEKHAKALAKRHEFMKQVEADGLAALKADLERRKKEAAKAKELEETKFQEMLQKRSKPFQRMARNGKTPAKDPAKFDPDLISHVASGPSDVQLRNLIDDLIPKDRPSLKKELSVGEYLGLANALMPIGSSGE